MAPSPDKKAFRNVLASSKNIIILSGAGLSSASGIPTYRGSINSLWNQNPVALATPENFTRDPGSSWSFSLSRRIAYLNANPNNAHRALAVLNNPSTLSRIAPEATFTPIHVTQNIDELSLRVLDALPQDVQDNAKQNLIQMHGSLFRTRCTSCQHVKHTYDLHLSSALKDLKQGEEIAVDKLPRCGGDSWKGSNRYGNCGNLLRPDVVWFGEVSPQLGEIARKMTWCDLLLVVGTSASVQPAASFPAQVKHHGGKVAIFNVDCPNGGENADFLFLGGCEETLPDVLGIQEDIASVWA
ncbi:hypothetical protein APHAL10511_008282 [Amanita phalloides]|nr:hypothetical protein APHAL10511_008282 [Amanita phalloides]